MSSAESSFIDGAGISFPASNYGKWPRPGSELGAVSRSLWSCLIVELIVEFCHTPDGVD